MKQYLNYFRWQKQRFFSPPKLSSFMEIERAERIFYLEYLHEDMMVFDVGANVGDLTLLFSRFALNGKVHAFEASRAAFEKLEIICRTAKRRNVILNHLALADEKGTIKLNIYDDDYLAFNSQAVRVIEESGKTVEPIGVEEVSATTIDDYCKENKIEQIDLLKIDVEGAEFQVLKGAKQMLESQSIKCIAFEFGQPTYDMGNSAEMIEDLLVNAGYQVRNLIKSEPVFPRRENPEGVYSMQVATPAKK
ncbi:MAG: FkbM family methyltransferase [Aridibacter sp.]